MPHPVPVPVPQPVPVAVPQPVLVKETVPVVVSGHGLGGGLLSGLGGLGHGLGH